MCCRIRRAKTCQREVSATNHPEPSNGSMNQVCFALLTAPRSLFRTTSVRRIDGKVATNGSPWDGEIGSAAVDFQKECADIFRFEMSQRDIDERFWIASASSDY